jgi:hypothetical protein
MEQDESEKMSLEHGKPSRSLEGGGGDVPQMNLEGQEDLKQSKCERGLGSSYVEDGGSAPLRLKDWLLGMRMRLNVVLGMYRRGAERRLSERGNHLAYEA